MRWSLKIGQIAGIKILVHWTFLLLLGWIFLLNWQSSHEFGAALFGVILVLALFACVVLHELGHALTARHFGVQTRDITLLPIGGVARLDRIPREPMQEFWVALAGPAVNVAIAGLLWLGFSVAGAQPLTHFQELSRLFWGQLMYANMILVAFNLLPAFPMDGGRVLRALLATRLEYARATTIAARIGQVIAILFGLLGLLVSPILLFVGLFVFLAAGGEARSVRLTTPMKDSKVQEAMITRFHSLSVDDPLNVAVNELLSGSQQDFPVVQDGQEVVGLLGRNELVQALAEKGPNARVGEAMRSDCPLITEYDKLEDCYEILRRDGCSTLPVVRQGRLIGLITLENLTEWIMVHAALNHSPPPAQAAA